MAPSPSKRKLAGSRGSAPSNPPIAKQINGIPVPNRRSRSPIPGQPRAKVEYSRCKTQKFLTTRLSSTNGGPKHQPEPGCPLFRVITVR